MSDTIYDENVKALAFYRDQIPIWWESSPRHFGKLEANDYSNETFCTLSPNQQASHCIWMCEEMLKRVKASSNNIAVDKIARWLGFVQGVTIIMGLSQISDERNRTRPWFTVPE